MATAITQPNRIDDEFDDDDLSDSETTQAMTRTITGVAHSFYLDDYVIPRFCDCCSELIWGFSRQGYSCSGT